MASRMAATSATVPSTHAWRELSSSNAASAEGSPLDRTNARNSSSDRRGRARPAPDERGGLGAHGQDQPVQVRRRHRRLLGLPQQIRRGDTLTAIDPMVRRPARQLHPPPSLRRRERADEALGVADHVVTARGQPNMSGPMARMASARTTWSLGPRGPGR